ncbi:MAG: PTS sugar transporter subunit IIA [Spirochaetes bacterium]|nr:PTS sugar transporter subunit IIA [Spirochaetota bacterium]
MLLQELFTPSRIKVNLESEDKEEVFEELVDLLVRSYHLEGKRDQILEAIREREQKMSTGIKTGIAVPHGKTNAIEGNVGVLGVSHKGIDYGALDGEPVYLVFLLVSSMNESEQHLKVLKKVASLIEYTDFYTKVMEADTAEKAHAVLKQFEDILDYQET